MEPVQSSSSSGKKSVPFPIDLNEFPLSSPRETVSDDDDVVEVFPLVKVKKEDGFPGSELQEGMLVCSGCGQRFRGREQQKEWKCFRCLLGNGKDRGVSGGGEGSGVGGVGLFDINASPPREAEGEGHFADLSVGVEESQRNHGSKIQTLLSTSFPGRPLSALGTQSDSSYKEKGFKDQKGSCVDAEFTKSDSEDTAHRRLPPERNSDMDLGFTIHGRVQGSNSTSLNCLTPSASELYLQGLKEYVTNRNGILGEGWHVEFTFCHNRYKTFAIYHSPDGNSFDSMSEVAKHLGLPSSCHSMAIDNGVNSFPLVTKGSHTKRRNENNKHGEGSFGSRVEVGIVDNGDPSFHRILDGFPVQFEDFFLISAGNIDPRPSYYIPNQIWPVGYNACWHDRITGSLFVCDVADGGDSGPIFKVKRYPCSTHPIPQSSTVLSRPNLRSSDDEKKSGKDRLTTLAMDDDDDLYIQAMLTECSPPYLMNDSWSTMRENEDLNSEGEKVLTPEPECLRQRSGNTVCDAFRQRDSIGEFLVEGRSSSSVWEMVSQTLLRACHEAYKQQGAIQFCCSHHMDGAGMKELENNDTLSKFSSLSGPNIKSFIQSDSEFNESCEMLGKWLKHERFGLDSEFVQEIIERMPGISACSDYKILNKRKNSTTLLTVGSGSLQVKRKISIDGEDQSDCYFRNIKRPKKQSEDSEMRAPCPSGKPLSSKLPAYLIGDALQAWEFSWRFSDVFGVGESFSFQELEDELINPWIQNVYQEGNPECETQDNADAILCSSSGESSQDRAASHHHKYTGLVLAETHSSLLKVLVGELLSKVAVHVDPNFDTGEYKSRRGRKKDSDHSAALKRMKLDMLPINELTWPEIARRYMLAVSSMEGNLESAEIASRESGRVFHCLRGDGGTLCGSLTGVAALEADAMLLAEATKKIFGSLKRKGDVFSINQKLPDAVGVSASDNEIPEWAQVLEPVRKLPTNVGARIRKCVHESLLRNPPEWARKVLEHSISKEVYKGNASGPTKRAVISVLADVRKDIPQAKPEKKEKVTSATSVSDLIMKQCRIVLRRVAADDEDRVFCNLLGRTILNPNDNDDEGLLGYPAMVSRPLDFRSIDLRLAAGAYNGSHDAFIDDVREVWHNIHMAYSGQSDFIELADKLSQQFEDLFEKEVLSLVEKAKECGNGNSLTGEADRERDNLLARVSESPLPKAPWDEGICKVCGMDKDDDNVLLCDSCDSEYHTYCLSPPLIRIPEGNWYCPSCIAGQSVARTASTQVFDGCGKRKYAGKEFTGRFVEALDRLANLMNSKEYWELTLEERIFLMKFLCDEALNSVFIREHLDQCASLSADLQQKMRSLISELKSLKFREEMLAANISKVKTSMCNGGDLGLDTSGPPVDVKLMGNLNDRGDYNSTFPGGFCQLEDGPQSNGWNDHVKQSSSHPSKGMLETSSVSISNHAKRAQQQENDQRGENGWSKFDQQQESGQSSSSGSMLSSVQVRVSHISSTAIDNHPIDHVSSPHVNAAMAHSYQCSNQADVNLSQALSLELIALKNEIRSLQDSIANKEAELLKVFVRKEFLGRDSCGRLYWVFGRSGASSHIIVNGNLSSQQKSVMNLASYGRENNSTLMGIGAPNLYSSSSWAYYQSDIEIEELVHWLREDDEREKELKESILLWQSNRSKVHACTENQVLNKNETNPFISSTAERASNSDFLVTRAASILAKRFGETGAEKINKNLTCEMKVPCKDGVYRCECLEPLSPCRHHCLSCHHTFPTNEELVKHSNEKCTSGSTTSKSRQVIQDSSKRKKMPRNEISLEKCSSNKGIPQAFMSRKQDNGSSFLDHRELECPFNFEEIKRKFIIPSSLRELIKDIGLIGSNGTPCLVSNESPCLDDPALRLISTTESKGTVGNAVTDLGSQELQEDGAADSIAGMNNHNIPERRMRSIENGIGEERAKSDSVKSRSLIGNLCPMKERSPVVVPPKTCIIPEFSLRRLTGRASEILRCLKMNLLDMDAALPEEALRPSRSQPDRRCAWRKFVKSADTIYELVQATILLEDAIKAEYLRNDWWYWSSPSAAAKISTLSALALRIYTLDSFILYEKLLSNGSTEILQPDCGSGKEGRQNSVVTNNVKPGSPTQKILNPDPVENPKPRSKMSKRRKDSGG